MPRMGGVPFFCKYDLNGDGKDELIFILKSVLGGFGRLLIIHEQDNQLKLELIKWERPVNALYFDYAIRIAPPKTYDVLAYKLRSTPSNILPKTREITTAHISTWGHLSRIVWWEKQQFWQEKVSPFE